MRSRLLKSAEAAAALFRTSNPEDEFFLVEFNNRAKLTIPFTNSSDEVYGEISHTHATGRTTLLDAINTALLQMKKARHMRKALVVLSDGGDNASRHSPNEIMRALIEADVTLYAMGIFAPDIARRPWEERNGPQLLEALAQQTGGDLYRVDSLEKLPYISEAIGRELRSVYMLGYYSTNPRGDGKYRQIRLRIAAADVHNLHVTYRRGYYSPTY